MEYFVGSILTLFTIAFCNLFIGKNKSRMESISVSFSQSRLHELLKPMRVISDLVKTLAKSENPTQAKKHYSGLHVKVIMSETEAYWIANNKFYVADVEDSFIVQETTREVDTMAMDDVQLKKIVEIVEMLGDSNDSGSSGNKGF